MFYIKNSALNFSFCKGNSSDESFIHDSPDDDSSDDEKEWVKQVRKNYRLIRRNEREKESDNENNDTTAKDETTAKNEIQNDIKFQEGGQERKKQNK